MAAANPAILSLTHNPAKLGNVDLLINAIGVAGVTVSTDRSDQSRKGQVKEAVKSLNNAIDALPPKDVARAVIGRIESLKHAPRADKVAIAALTTTILDAASSFAARDAEAAAKVTPKLPEFPIRDAAEVAKRQLDYAAWTAAPSAARASVHLRIPYDSYALGTTAPPPKKWPKWRGRPTIVADPLTEIEGDQLTTITPMGALAKKLVHGEKCMEGQAGYAA